MSQEKEEYTYILFFFVFPARPSRLRFFILGQVYIMANRPRRRYVRKMVGKRKSRRMTKKSVAKVAKAVYHRLTENKVKKLNKKYFLHNDPNNVVWADNVQDCCASLRSITQGTGTADRIGARIKLRKMTYSYTLTPVVTQESSEPLIVKMWIVTDRFSPYTSSTQNVIDACKTASTSIGNWFEDNNSSAGMSRNLYDIFSPINAERFNLYKAKEFKIGLWSSPDNQQTVFGYGNNDFKFYRRGRINLLRYLPKTFRYIDNQTNTQMSRKIFIVWQVVAARNSVTLDSTADYIEVAEGYNIQYEDA